jgi:hypothetical protein
MGSFYSAIHNSFFTPQLSLCPERLISANATYYYFIEFQKFVRTMEALLPQSARMNSFGQVPVSTEPALGFAGEDPPDEAVDPQGKVNSV